MAPRQACCIKIKPFQPPPLQHDRERGVSAPLLFVTVRYRSIGDGAYVPARNQPTEPRRELSGQGAAASAAIVRLRLPAMSRIGGRMSRDRHSGHCHLPTHCFADADFPGRAYRAPSHCNKARGLDRNASSPPSSGPKTGGSDRAARTLPTPRHLAEGKLHMDGMWFAPFRGTVLALNHEEIVCAALPAAQRRLKGVVLRRFGGDRATSEDVLQDFAVQALRKAGTLRDPARLDAWLVAVLRTVMADHGRRRKRLRETSVDPASLIDAVPAPEPELDSCVRLDPILSDMRIDQADLLRRVDLGGEQSKSAASRLGIHANALHVRLHRARMALRGTILAHCPSCTARASCRHASP